MGRKKIVITPISNEKQRNITFNKRKNGLLKKAAELSLLCGLKLFLAFTDLNGNLINFYTPDSDFLNEFDFSKDDKKLITFTEKDYPDFFKVNHYKKKMGGNSSDSGYPISSITHGNPKPFLHFKKHKYISKQSTPSLPLPKQKIEEIKKNDDAENDKQLTKLPKKQLTIKIPEKNKSLEFEMNMLKKVNTMNPDEFLSNINDSNSFKGGQMLTSQIDLNLRNEPLDAPFISQEKNPLQNKNPEESEFLRALLSNNKNLQNFESATNQFYFPLANLPSKEGAFGEEGFKALDSKNINTNLATMNTHGLSFNDFLQLFNMNNNGGDDYLKFLNLNSSRMSAAGLNTGGRFGFGNLTSQGFGMNFNQMINGDMEKDEREYGEEGDNIRKKRKMD